MSEDNTIPAPKVSTPPTTSSEPPKSRRSRRTKAQMEEARNDRVATRHDGFAITESRTSRSVKDVAMSYMPTFIAIVALIVALVALRK